MKLLDVNVLVAAYRADHPHHPRARPWLERISDQAVPFAVPTLSAVGFLRLTTGRALSPASTVTEATAFLGSLHGQQGCVQANPGPQHWAVLRQLCADYDVRGERLPDAHLAALAVEHAGTVVSFDRDFARFSSVRWEIPGGA